MPSRETTATVLGACGIAIPALLAAGGAAARPGGTWQGVPGWGPFAGILAAVVVLALAAHRRGSLAACAGLLLPVALLLAGAPLAGVRALSGPPLVALALAGVAIAVAGSGLRPPRALFLPLAFAVLAAVAAQTHARVGPEGDEPHYLMVAESLLRDGDVSLERDYAEGRYAVFHDAPLAPHFRVRGKGGEVHSLHAVGLSVLILPAWALAGYAGVTVFMALLAALVALEVREWVRELTGRDGLADAAGWAFALSPPLVHYAGLVFTEVPAALALSFGLRHARRADLGPAGALAVGLAAAALPWLNVRYAPLAVLVVAHALWRHPRARVAVAALAPAVVSAAGLLVYHQVLYGFWDPRRVYGRRPELALSTLAEGLPGLLLDQEFGLLVYAPVLALALPGFAFLWRRDRRLAIVVGAAVGVVLLTAGAWPMWRGGFNPPARFLVPIAPLLAVAVAMAWDRRGLTAGASLLLGWTLWTGLAGAFDPQLVHRDRDGTAPLFRQLSGAREWTGLLPAYVLGDPDRHRLGAVWAVAILAALPWRARVVTAGRVAAAGLGLVLAGAGGRDGDPRAHRRPRRGPPRGPPGGELARLERRVAGECLLDAGDAGLGAALRAAPRARRGRGRPPPSASRRTLPADPAGRSAVARPGHSPAGGRAGPPRGARAGCLRPGRPPREGRPTSRFGPENGRSACGFAGEGRSC